jgi:hypothetical protein
MKYRNCLKIKHRVAARTGFHALQRIPVSAAPGRIRARLLVSSDAAMRFVRYGSLDRVARYETYLKGTPANLGAKFLRDLLSIHRHMRSSDQVLNGAWKIASASSVCIK